MSHLNSSIAFYSLWAGGCHITTWREGAWGMLIDMPKTDRNRTKENQGSDTTTATAWHDLLIKWNNEMMRTWLPAVLNIHPLLSASQWNTNSVRSATPTEWHWHAVCSLVLRTTKRPLARLDHRSLFQSLGWHVRLQEWNQAKVNLTEPGPTLPSILADSTIQS